MTDPLNLDPSNVNILTVGPQDRLVIRVDPRMPRDDVTKLGTQIREFWPDLAGANRIAIVAAEQIVVVHPGEALTEGTGDQ